MDAPRGHFVFVKWTVWSLFSDWRVGCGCLCDDLPVYLCTWVPGKTLTFLFAKTRILFVYVLSQIKKKKVYVLSQFTLSENMSPVTNRRPIFGQKLSPESGV